MWKGRKNKVGDRQGPCTVLTKHSRKRQLANTCRERRSDVSFPRRDASNLIPYYDCSPFPFLYDHSQTLVYDMFFMRVLSCLSVLLLALAVVAGDAPTELKIDRTYIPEDCKVTSQKGDRLHMHYVSILLTSQIEASAQHMVHRLASFGRTGTSSIRGETYTRAHAYCSEILLCYSISLDRGQPLPLTRKSPAS